MITPDVKRLRLKNSYDAMCNFPFNTLFSWKVAEGQKPPYVSSYIITYYVKTMVKDGGRLVPQYKTVVRIDLPDSASGLPSTHIVSGKIPFHPNFYINGKLCNGDFCTDPLFWKYVINVGKVIAFDPTVTNPASPANVAAADDWNAKMRYGNKPYPCGDTKFPYPMGVK